MMFKRKVLGVVVSSWALVLAVSVVPVYSAGNGDGDQSNLEPDNGGGYCIDCHEHQD